MDEGKCTPIGGDIIASMKRPDFCEYYLQFCLRDFQVHVDPEYVRPEQVPDADGCIDADFELIDSSQYR